MFIIKPAVMNSVRSDRVESHAQVDSGPYYQTIGISTAEIKVDYCNLLSPLSWCLIKVILSQKSSH